MSSSNSDEEKGELEDIEEKRSCICCLFCMFLDFLSFRWLFARGTSLRMCQCALFLANIFMIYGYIVLVNDVIAHSYDAVGAGPDYHGTPFIVDKTQRFYE